MARIDAILQQVKEQGASDLHITTGAPPMIRINGEITPIPYERLTPEVSELLLFEIMDAQVRGRYDQAKDVDFSYEVPGVVRVRCNIYEQSKGVAGAFRILPNRVFERHVPIVHINADFPLIDDGSLAGKQILDGVLNGKNMDWFALIDVIQHGRQGRALAAAGNAGKDDHALIIQAQFFHYGRKVKLLESGDLGIDAAGHQAQLAALVKEIDAEAALASADNMSEVRPAHFLEQVLRSLREDWSG